MTRTNYESERNMLFPNKRIAYAYLGMLAIASMVFFSFYIPAHKENKTRDNLYGVAYLLMLEKKHTGTYPENLKNITRFDPGYPIEEATKDYWNRDLYYTATENGQRYILASKGKDGKIHTEDDIIHKVRFSQ